MPADGTALANTAVLVKPARMTREPTFTPRPRPEPTTPENGGAQHSTELFDTLYAANMPSQWKTLQRFAENLVFNEAPRFMRELQNSPTMREGIQRGIKIGIDVLTGAPTDPPTAITAGRPVTSTSVPTAHRARKLVYAPNLDGRADPGEIVWTWVVYEDDPSHGKDRPVLVVGRDRHTLLGLMLSSQQRHSADRDWVGIGSGSWDEQGRSSWVRLDRVLDVPEEGIRREGAILQAEIFDVVAARLRCDYSWS